MVAKHLFGVARVVRETELLFAGGLVWVERQHELGIYCMETYPNKPELGSK